VTYFVLVGYHTAWSGSWDCTTDDYKQQTAGPVQQY
jgi:hypothetical protein